MVKRSLSRSALMFISDSWDNVMDARYNPLRFIRDPSLQAYFTLVLFLMWSVYFGVVASYYRDEFQHSDKYFRSCGSFATDHGHQCRF